MKIVIPGGSGQIGQILALHFHAKGHAVMRTACLLQLIEVVKGDQW